MVKNMKKRKKETPPTEGEKKKSGLLSTILLVLMFLVGLAVMLYPKFSDWYYSTESNHLIEGFDKAVETMNQEDIDHRIALAKAYNDSLLTSAQSMQDPFEEERLKQGRREYARMLQVQELIGHIEIPKLLVDLPIYAGTSEDVLQSGVGHMPSSSLPIGGNNTHCVLTAHRGLPKMKLFTDLDRLTIGDKFYIRNLKETLAYQVDQIETVEPTDFSKLLIVPGHDYVTLLTCTPYMVNSHRLLVRGHRVDYVPAVQEKEILEHKAVNTYKWLFYVTLVILIFVLLLLLRNYLKRRKEHRKLQAEEAAAIVVIDSETAASKSDGSERNRREGTRESIPGMGPNDIVPDGKSKPETNDGEDEETE